MYCCMKEAAVLHRVCLLAWGGGSAFEGAAVLSLIYRHMKQVVLHGGSGSLRSVKV